MCPCGGGGGWPLLYCGTDNETSKFSSGLCIAHSVNYCVARYERRQKGKKKNAIKISFLTMWFDLFANWNFFRFYFYCSVFVFLLFQIRISAFSCFREQLLQCLSNEIPTHIFINMRRTQHKNWYLIAQRYRK